MPGRTYSPAGYRYGFNTKEVDNDIKGNGNSIDFGARMYDSRLGRWLKTDIYQAAYADLSPYNYAANSPLVLLDPDGETISVYFKGKKYTYNGSHLIDANGNLYVGHKWDFANRALKDLNNIRTGGSEGFRLVTNLIESSRDITIRKSNFNETNATLGIDIHYDPFSNTDIPTLGQGTDNYSLIGAPSYISLAHELYHVEDYIYGMTPKLLGVDAYDLWVTIPGDGTPENPGKPIYQGDKYATFGENLIRQEHGLSLRSQYGIKDGQPFRGSDVLDFGTKQHKYIFGEIRAKWEKIKPKPKEGDGDGGSGGGNNGGGDSKGRGGGKGGGEDDNGGDDSGIPDIPSGPIDAPHGGGPAPKSD